MTARLWHGTVALLVVLGLVLQVWVMADLPAEPAAHAVGTLRGAPFAGRLLRLVSFFTIQSNILSALVSGQLARDPNRDGAGWRVLRLAALFGITVTGIVYSTVLAATHEPNGWRETIINAIFHYVVPIAMVLGWLLFGPRPRIRLAVIGWALVWPLLYFGYVLILGAVTDWYPYPFVAVSDHGYGRVLLNAVAVIAVFGALAGGYAWLDRLLPPKPAQPASARTTREGLGLPS